MRFPSEIFCTVLLFIFARNSKADIPECNYFDTVDISNVERQNDSYLYDDIPIPANLTGDYDYKMFGRLRMPDEKRLRACVCKLRPCIRICCPIKYTLANGKCVDGLQEELARLKSYIYLTSATDLSTKTRVPLTEMAIIRDQFLPCDEMVQLKDEFTYVENGTLLIPDGQLSIEKQYYCLYPYQFNSDFPNSMWIVKHSCITYMYPGYKEIITISIICFILTIAVYLYIKDLRNVTGKCIISCMVSRLIQYLIILLINMKVLNSICSLAGYSLYFFWRASNLWLSVISYQLWKLLTSLNRTEPTYRFQLYNAFVWTTAAVMTGSIYMVNLMWENDLYKWNWLPLVGFIKCGAKFSSTSSWIYESGPSLILSTFNIVMFTLTAIYIRKVKGEIKRFAHEEEGRMGCIHIDSETYLQFLRLSVVMGLTWIIDVIPFSARFEFVWKQIIMITDYYHYAFGIVLFTLLVLKRSTLTLLMRS
ncbi:probable G-protein coupled receptor Mth-like 7 [Drosophila yakuba]|uniref:G-protein coupled receptors family 2 profile 2 domain-containing protein n=1 Tax=Drosophila yakuba TaxID=7245 RepID=B4PCT9_DROYA|nr:probable G-protein coupled receptor Mth-like 7 [Drosophila yakuba]EDW93843.1 uncharacterized protein Dyak_GE20366 [Drosophila yakuba]